MNALRNSRLLKLGDFEVWRRRGAASLLLAAALIIAYWILWVLDRGAVASAHNPSYTAFEQAFPLADAWLLGAALTAAIQLWRRRPSALLWVSVVGGAGMYLFSMDVLYDIQHGIYANGHGGVIELAINIATAALSIGGMSAGWYFRHHLDAGSPSSSSSSAPSQGL
ncbi:MAG: hypothetical protein ACRDK2_00440 [Solirubrobacteraceae bacterium]